MKVFLSWSGERSQRVAELLNTWLKCVIQACTPWISSRDLDRGALWFGEINDQLKDTSVGIICLTQENKIRPWILFEAGALAKGLTTAKVCTLLVDLDPKDVQDPLAQFNHTFPNHDSMYSLVRTLNNSLPNNGLDERILETVFKTYWPQFESEFEKLLRTTETQPAAKPRDTNDVLGEVLEVTRALNSRMRGLEQEVLMNREGSRTMRVGLPNSVRRKIRDELEHGMPTKFVMDHYHGKFPTELLFDEIERFESENRNIHNEPLKI